MASGALGCSSVLPRRSRSGRPRPVSYLGIVAFLSCWGCLRPFFSQSSDGGAGGGTRGRSAGSDDGEDAEAPLVPTTKDANSQVGDKRIHSNDKKNDDVVQLKLHHLTKILDFLPLLNTHLMNIVNFSPPLEDRLTAIRNILARLEICVATNRDSSTAPAVTDTRNILARLEICVATNRDSSTAPAVTDTTANKDAMNRMKGLLGSMGSIVDKLPMFYGTIFLWLLSNSASLNSSPNSPASKAGQNFKNPWMQVLITGNLILCFISFMPMALASKFKDSESIDGVLCKIFIWLLLPVSLALWPGLCMILHFFAHTPVFVLWPLGALFSILSLYFWYWGFYKEQQKILKELNEGGVLEKGILPEKPESEAALAKV